MMLSSEDKKNKHHLLPGHGVTFQRRNLLARVHLKKTSKQRRYKAIIAANVLESNLM